MAIPKKALTRAADGLKRFQPVLASAKSRDVNESDTAVIVTDVLQDIFGYDKYTEITSEYMIRSTYCDLAIKLGGQIALLIEVKAIGLELKDAHVKQAVDYAANQGVDWVVLTNGQFWQCYKVSFKKPIEHELVVELDLLALNHRKSGDLALIALLTKEGWKRAQLGEYHEQRQALSRFILGGLIVSDQVVNLLRREVRRLAPDVRVSASEVAEVLQNEVLKRDILVGEEADDARRRIARAAKRRQQASKAEATASQKVPDESA